MNEVEFLITQKLVQELLNYDAATGVFTWRPRPIVDRASKIWNTRFANKQAGGETEKGYLQIRINNKWYRAHRLAWLYVYGKFPDHTIDHINGNKKDNRLCNLRDVPSAVNTHNTAIDKTNSSGIVGVVWRDNICKWRAYIGEKDNRRYLGNYSSFIDACFARWRAELKRGPAPRNWRRQKTEIGVLWIPILSPAGVEAIQCHGAS